MEIVAMERFTGLKSAAAEELPARGRSRIFSTSRTWPGMLSMNAAGTSGKNVTSGAGVPTALTEIVTLGRTLKRRAEHSSKQEDSDPNYTLNYEEPLNFEALVLALTVQ